MVSCIQRSNLTAHVSSDSIFLQLELLATTYPTIVQSPVRQYATYRISIFAIIDLRASLARSKQYLLHNFDLPPPMTQ
jgi:hypothetical protein